MLMLLYELSRHLDELLVNSMLAEFGSVSSGRHATFCLIPKLPTWEFDCKSSSYLFRIARASLAGLPIWRLGTCIKQKFTSTPPPG
jgi:hypothetical protein